MKKEHITSYSEQTTATAGNAMHPIYVNPFSIETGHAIEINILENYLNMLDEVHTCLWDLLWMDQFQAGKNPLIDLEEANVMSNDDAAAEKALKIQDRYGFDFSKDLTPSQRYYASGFYNGLELCLRGRADERLVISPSLKLQKK